jgi:hypothetical protein
MTELHFHDEITLAEQAEKLGKQAMKLGLISTFAIHFFSDSWEFYIPNEKDSPALSPEEAYLHLKKILTNHP